MNALLVILASTLTLTAPENGAKYDTHSPCVHEFLQNQDKRSNPRPPEPPLSEEEQARKADMDAKWQAWLDGGKQGKSPKQWQRRWNYYERNAWTEDLYQRCVKETRSYKPFTWTADFKPKYFYVEFSETDDFKKVITEKVKREMCIRPHFLKVNQNYFWRVKATDDAGKEVVSDVRSFSTLDAFPRILGNPDTNWREHGGGVNADGKRVRQGMIYRSNAPLNSSTPLNDDPEAPPASVESSRAHYLGTLGLKSQMDLRGPNEAAEAEKAWGRVQLDKCGVDVHFFSVDPYYINGYSKPTYVAAIKFLANKDVYPVMYNCAAGCDRTGTIGVLIDGILNRTDEQIYDDYELPSLTPFSPRLRYCRKAESLFTVLKRYGKPTIRENVVAYLLESGVTQEEIDTIRKIMIED